MNEQHEPEMERFPDPVNRALFLASGEVQEGRRFAQFLYILMRDHTNTHVVGLALRRTITPEGICTVEWAAAYLREHPELFVSPSRLVDDPNERHTLFVVQLCTLCRHGETGRIPNVISLALANTPEKDDVVAFISNGWLMRYCQFVVDTLQRGLPS